MIHFIHCNRSLSKICKFIFSFILIAILSGCAGVQLPPSKGNITETSEVLTFKKASDDIALPTNNEINNAILAAVIEASKYNSFRLFGNSSEVRKGKGLKVSLLKDKIKLEYINGDFFPSGTEFMTKSVASLNIRNIEEEGKKLITLTTPPFIETIHGNEYFGASIKPLGNDQQLSSDVLNIVKNLKPIIIGQKEFKGEINSNFNDESIYANFERILGAYQYGINETKKFDIKKDRIFKVKTESTGKMPIKIEVYPYRDGSKALYEFDYKYQTHGDGSNTFNLKEINSLIGRIESIVNN